MDTSKQILIQVELVVVGSGPAGLAAAEAAARQGIKSLLVERSPSVGGQYKGVNLHETDSRTLDKEIQAIEHLTARVDELGIKIIRSSTLYRADPGTLLLSDVKRNYKVNYQVLILATGARERVMPFPGWTLPGVMTIGAAQRMLVQADTLPGKRVLVAGSGPYLIGCAAMLVEAGADVLAVVETAGLWEYLMKGAQALGSNWHLWGKFARDVNSLRKAKVRILAGQTILEAQGTEQVETAYTAGLDLSGNPIAGSRRTWHVDAVCVAHGLIANTRLAQALGCELAYDPMTESFFVAHNERLESSQPDIYACGEAAGIGGVRKAMLEGELAGLLAATRLRPELKKKLDSRVIILQQERKRLIRSVHRINAMYPTHQQLAGLAGADTIVCRCEEVRAQEVQTALREGNGTLRDLKMRTRLGMGACQGRMCEHYATHELALHLKVSPEKVNLLKVRPPLEPVGLHILADLPKED